jgi:hypothetical protein
LEGRAAVNFAHGLNTTVANVARRILDAGHLDSIHPNSPFHTAVGNVADRIARLDQVWDAYASNFANVTGQIRSLAPIPSVPGFRTAALSFADRLAHLGKDLTAYAQAEVRLAGAFNGLGREIVDLSQKLGGGFALGLGDETPYNFASDGKYLTLAEWVQSKRGLGWRAPGAAVALFGVAIGTYSAIEVARELAGGKSFMAAMENVTNPITSRIVQGLNHSFRGHQ